MGKKILFFTLGLFLSLGIALAQTRTVTGTITLAEDGSPAIGASVVVKGTTLGVVTDVYGKFVLTGVPTNATTLEISSIGMIPVEVPVQNVVNVALEPDMELLDEAVVTIAYGAAKRSEKLEIRPNSSVTSALEGTVSGVMVNSTYGAPGSDPSIRIRGFGTVNGSSSPLYVLDGVPFSGNVSDLNPADIESLTVLKDAASAALYGNRASNGVILITTKKGAAIGRVSVTADIKAGTYSRGIPEYDLASEFMEIQWQELARSIYTTSQGSESPMTLDEAKLYATQNLIADKVYLNIFEKADDALFDANGMFIGGNIKKGYADDLDWYKDGLRDGFRQEYNLSASAASDKSDYYFSVGYLSEDGYVKNSGCERVSARAAVFG